MLSRLLLLTLLLSLSACSSVSYWSHLVKGQTELLWDREDVSELLAADETPENLRQRLLLSEKIRAFAQVELHLPVDQAYSSYTALDRPYAVWNVYAAPELSLESYTWCYPIVGCMAYRGYYDEAMAQAQADELRQMNYDVKVGGVRAYSTIGYFDDPILSSFVFTNEVYFVELLIHEIAHRKLYIENDTKFNENFATAVAELGAERWYRSLDDHKKFLAYQARKHHYGSLVNFLLSYRAKLATLYDSSLSEDEMRNEKQALLSSLRDDYEMFKQHNNLDNRYDNWVHSMNNASFATLSNYQEWVPAFLKLFDQVGRDWQKFYQEVETISRLNKAERAKALEYLLVHDD